MSAASPAGFRPDIQGLRAIAVSLVLVYHLQPTLLQGGYVGVDVFFVISGFLITSHLLQHPPRTGGDLAGFWARRIRRLLPAAFLVLAATAVASRVLAPVTQWEAIATEIAASALYVQNWVLAATAVDYLAATNLPTPTQHFWSLSLEEQFYLFWPVVILAVAWIARRKQMALEPVARAAILLVIAASLVVSITATASEPASAYFVTPTRVWELATGALLATLPVLVATRLPAWVASAAAWTGIAMITLAAVTYSGATPFPGSAALLPVLGSALVLVAAARGPRSPTPFLALRPVQHVGDTSYSIYLWHWPLIVLAPYVTGTLGWVDTAVIVVATLTLATLTKVLVEDPFRAGDMIRGLVPTYRFAAVGMVVLVAVSAVQVAEIRVRTGQAVAQASAVEMRATDCFGASAIVRGFDACPQDPAASPVPEPVVAKTDRSDAYADDCWTNAPYTDRTICTYGDGPLRVALVGNSHAGQWLPPLQVLADRRGWTISTFLVSQCNLTDAPLQFDASARTDTCLAYGRWVQEQTSGDAFDLVITSARQSVPVLGETYATTPGPATAGYASYLARWAAEGTRVLVLHDTPDPGRTLKSVPDCLASNPGNADTCAGTPDSWAWMDPLYDAAQAAGHAAVDTHDPRQWLCTDTSCPAVIGTVVVYFDASHMTATYARTLAPYLEPVILRALEPSAR